MHQEFPSRSFGFVVNDVARLWRNRFEQRARAAALGLTRAQSSVLANLARHEGVNQATLAQLLDIEPITLARLLDRLQAAELIERRPDHRDRRAHRLYLTEAAFPLVERMFGLGADLREEALAGIPESERDRLLDALITIKSNLARRAEAEPSEAVANG